MPKSKLRFRSFVLERICLVSGFHPVGLMPPKFKGCKPVIEVDNSNAEELSAIANVRVVTKTRLLYLSVSK